MWEYLKTIPLPVMIMMIAGAVILFLLYVFGDSFGAGNLNKMKRAVVGDGQHGAARLATDKEIKRSVVEIPFEPEKWRNDDSRPNIEGFVIGYRKSLLGKITALVDTSDSHILVVGSPGAGKSTSIIIPNVEYCFATGLSFFNTDSKGDIIRKYGDIAKLYGFELNVIDFRFPNKSMPFNLLQSMNNYMDLFKETGKERYRSLAERYAKITASTIVHSKGFVDGGANSFFYDAAEGLIASTCLLVSEFCQHGERHIASVFKLILEMMSPSTKSTKENQVTKFQEIMDMLPVEHKAKWLAGSSLISKGQSFSSVISTAMSRLLSLMETDMEQILCFDSPYTMQDICTRKVATFIVFPEEQKPKHVLISIMLSQFYNEAIAYADEFENQCLSRRLYFLEDEAGIFPKQENITETLAAARSRNIFLLLALQVLAQFADTYSQNGMKKILGTCNTVIYGGFAPASDDPEFFSKGLGYQTVLGGSVSQSSNSASSFSKNSSSRNMVKRELMTADELKHCKRQIYDHL